MCVFQVVQQISERVEICNAKKEGIRKQNSKEMEEAAGRVGEYNIFMKQEESTKIQASQTSQLKDIKIDPELYQCLQDNYYVKLEDLVPSLVTEYHQQNAIVNQLLDPKDLKANFLMFVKKSNKIHKKGCKGTNIPKFLLRIFKKNLPSLSPCHKTRVDSFYRQLSRSQTRFDLVRLFGPNPWNPTVNSQNALNRAILLRQLHCNYENVLSNKNIQNKRVYLLFCKKVMLRLSQPEVIDRMEV